MQPSRLILKALTELGPKQTSLYLRYQFALRLGLVRRATADTRTNDSLEDSCFELDLRVPIPGRDVFLQVVSNTDLEEARQEAEEILDGSIRLFGGEPVALRLDWGDAQPHWTDYETGKAAIPAEDVKYIWEPARLGWAVRLARACHLCGDERYARKSLQGVEEFLEVNPPYRGPNWISAQEAAIRILAINFIASLTANSPAHTAETRLRLARAIAAHARRIPPSLAYARAQNNNHLLLEGLGLYTAGVCLPRHPLAARWRLEGFHWFQRALQSQIADDGTYVQHSTNYHRLMLQAALWGWMLSRAYDDMLSATVLQRLSAATSWLLALVDERHGHVPNLGPNDGAYILPLSAGEFADYRPVAQAAARAFLGSPAFPPGPWDEMSAWFGLPLNAEPTPPAHTSSHAKAPQVVLTHPGLDSRVYLRVAHFGSRPGHADQLHLDVWSRGENLGLDAGTYLYNAPPPWQNALTGAGVHNTLTIDGIDQMTRAGRFLWLDWAQAEVLLRETDPRTGAQSVVARHDGYRRAGMIHRRSLQTRPNGWEVEDLVVAVKPRAQAAGHLVRLHWLLPDTPWELDEDSHAVALRLSTSAGPVKLSVGISQAFHAAPAEIERGAFSLARAGESLIGDEPVPARRGWFSPTYAHKFPALSLAYSVRAGLPLALVSRWELEG